MSTLTITGYRIDIREWILEMLLGFNIPLHVLITSWYNDYLAQHIIIIFLLTLYRNHVDDSKLVLVAFTYPIRFKASAFANFK